MRLAALALAVSIGFIAFARDPVPPGPFLVRASDLPLLDLARSRRVEALLLIPQGEGPFPFVLFSPGFLLSGRQYRSTGELLASHGIATALLTYDVNLFTADHRVLVQDLRLALDQLPTAAEERGIALDRERIGLVGHSLGGKLSFLAAVDEPHVRAVAGLDPVDRGARGTDDPVRFPRAGDRMGEVIVPKLFLGAERGGETRFGMPCAPRESNYERLFEQAADMAWEITQLGAGHMDYLDNPNCGLACAVCVPGADPTRAREAAQAYLILFFRAHLHGEVQSWDDLVAQLDADAAAGRVRVRMK